MAVARKKAPVGSAEQLGLLPGFFETPEKFVLNWCRHTKGMPIERDRKSINAMFARKVLPVVDNLDSDSRRTLLKWVHDQLVMHPWPMANATALITKAAERVGDVDGITYWRLTTSNGCRDSRVSSRWFADTSTAGACLAVCGIHTRCCTTRHVPLCSLTSVIDYCGRTGELWTNVMCAMMIWHHYRGHRLSTPLPKDLAARSDWSVLLKKMEYFDPTHIRYREAVAGMKGFENG